MGSELEKLAERVEKAEQGDLGLDKAILTALGYTWRGMAYWHRDGNHTWPGAATVTRSLDAALTLVPEGCLFSVRTLWDEAKTAGSATINRYISDDKCRRYFHGDWSGTAATPALALTAAALRARAALKDTPA